jgi:hypothetical protein
MRFESQIRTVPHLQVVRNLTNYLSPQFTDLRFAELICEPPTFANNIVLYFFGLGWVGL